VPGSAANPEPNTTAVNAAAAAAVQPVAAEPPQTSLFDAMYMNLTIGIPDDLVLKGQDIKPANGAASLGDANVTVGGNIYVTKAPGDVVRLTGDVNTVRGTYTFQGRRFELSRDGRIRFTGTDQMDPLLDIEASRVISGVQAFVRVRGSMTKPELSFRSNPPLEEADVLSLIVFNQPVNELGEGQQASLAQRAGGLASGYLASGLSRSIGNALNLNEFEIQAAGENGQGPSVQVGQQVGKNLFVRLRQGFGNASETEFILEYQLSRLLRLQATAAQVGGGAERVQFRRVERGGLDLIFFFAY
jgi:autotransporter translocation and assembly factor TamB